VALGAWPRDPARGHRDRRGNQRFDAGVNADGGPLELATELVEGSVVAVVRAPVEYALAIK
jgi:hypothetical protein